jgi:hypothetical protein
VVSGVVANAGTFAAGVLTLGAVALPFAGTYHTGNFHIVGAGGQTTVTYQVACFAAGTRILTATGEIAVEALAPGDLVVTRAGRLRPVRWIGHRRVRDVDPVHISPDAFGPGMPHRALVLSPDHAVHWEGALIPVRHLCNGATVRRQAVEEIDYYHVELDAHDILLAEGLPAESYLDTGNRLSLPNSWVSKGPRPLAGPPTRKLARRGQSPGLT